MAAALLAACAAPSSPPLAPVALAPQVDLARFMGDWYVIAAIPTVFERDASTRRTAIGSRPTAASRRRSRSTPAPSTGAQGSGSRGFVVAGSGNAVWGQQYVRPIKADYRIAYLAADYSQAVVAREKRDYVWIMARTPTIAAADLDRLTAFVAAQGYDTNRLRRMPQAGAR